MGTYLTHIPYPADQDPVPAPKRKGKGISILKHAALNQIAREKGGNGSNTISVFRSCFADKEAGHPTMGESFRSDFFSVVQVVSGTMVLRLDHEEFTLGPNGTMLAAPHTVKKILHYSTDLVVQGVSFTGDMMKEAKQAKMLERMALFTSRRTPVLHLDPADGAVFTELLQRIDHRLAQLELHSHGRELLANSFSDLLYELSEFERKHAATLDRTIGRKEELVVKFSRLAREHCLDERNLAYYSEHLFVTPKYLSETVKEITGKTAGQIIDELNVLEAKRLLEETDLGVGEIADRLLFRHPALFSKFFSRLNGRSPRAYRASLSGAPLRAAG